MCSIDPVVRAPAHDVVADDVVLVDRDLNSSQYDGVNKVVEARRTLLYVAE